MNAIHDTGDFSEETKKLIDAAFDEYSQLWKAEH